MLLCITLRHTNCMTRRIARKQRKTAVFTMRLAGDELEALKKEAKRRGKTPSGLMRELLRQEIARGEKA
jgi:predicted DNA binding CopG/RHH family protein